MNELFNNRLKVVTTEYERLITLKNEPVLPGNGIFERYKNPVLTADHAPVF
ncbi:MAG: glycosidase, partial [Prevotella sp.]|nr:glycosidase [Prevotella sp.]